MIIPWVFETNCCINILKTKQYRVKKETKKISTFTTDHRIYVNKQRSCAKPAYKCFRNKRKNIWKCSELISVQRQMLSVSCLHRREQHIGGEKQASETLT